MAFAQNSLTIGAIFQQSQGDLSQLGYLTDPGVMVQLWGKERLRGLPIRFQTGIEGSYMQHTNSAGTFNTSDPFSGGTAIEVSNHVARLGVSGRLITGPSALRVFGEISGGLTYVRGVLSYPLDETIRPETFVDNFSLYYRYGAGVQYRLTSFLWAHVAMHVHRGTPTRFVDLASIPIDNGQVTITEHSGVKSSFTDFTLGLNFRIGNHDQARNRNNRGRNPQNNRNRKRNPDPTNRDKRTPSYWDRG